MADTPNKSKEPGSLNSPGDKHPAPKYIMAAIGVMLPELFKLPFTHTRRGADGCLWRLSRIY